MKRLKKSALNSFTTFSVHVFTLKQEINRQGGDGLTVGLDLRGFFQP